MNRIILLFILAFTAISPNLFSQSFHTLIEPNKVWDILYRWDWGGPLKYYQYSRYYFSPDGTVIDGITYKPVNSLFIFYAESFPPPPSFLIKDTVPVSSNVLLRDDTSARRIYYYDPLMAHFTRETC